MKKNVLVAVAIAALVAAGAWYAVSRNGTSLPAPSPSPTPTPAPKAQPIATLHYTCDNGRTIDAVLYDGSSTPPRIPYMPPTPGGSADVSLSDGRSMHLHQTISADGVRYANTDESFIFWTKGNGAFVMEGNAQTYANCVQSGNSSGSTAPTSTASSTGQTTDMKVVTQAESNSTVHLAKNERFQMKLGGTLRWNLVFTPTDIITLVPNSTTADGSQGIYEGSVTGTATLRATGAPICSPHMACPQFLVSVSITFVVGP